MEKDDLSTDMSHEPGTAGEGKSFKPYDPHFLQRQLAAIRAAKPKHVHAYIDRLANTYSPDECLSILAQTRHPVQSLLKNLVNNSGALHSPGYAALFTLRLAASYVLSAEWDRTCAWWAKREVTRTAGHNMVNRACRWFSSLKG